MWTVADLRTRVALALAGDATAWNCSTSEEIMLAFAADDLARLPQPYTDVAEAWRRLNQKQRATVLEARPDVSRLLRLANAGTIAERCDGRLTPVPDPDAKPMPERVAILAANVRIMREMLGKVPAHYPQDPDDLADVQAWIEKSDRTIAGCKAGIRVLGAELAAEQEEERRQAEEAARPRRGRRPVAGGAMTGAERQRMYRARQREDLGIVEVTLKVPADQVDEFRRRADEACAKTSGR